MQFLNKKEDLKVSIERLKEQREWLDTRTEKVQELTEKVFDFACRTRESFIKWSLKEKKRDIIYTWSELYSKRLSIGYRTVFLV